MSKLCTPVGIQGFLRLCGLTNPRIGHFVALCPIGVFFCVVLHEMAGWFPRNDMGTPYRTFGAFSKLTTPVPRNQSPKRPTRALKGF
jgi:hypothetical protein